ETHSAFCDPAPALPPNSGTPGPPESVAPAAASTSPLSRTRTAILSASSVADTPGVPRSRTPVRTPPSPTPRSLGAHESTDDRLSTHLSRSGATTSPGPAHIHEIATSLLVAYLPCGIQALAMTQTPTGLTLSAVNVPGTKAPGYFQLSLRDKFLPLHHFGNCSNFVKVRLPPRMTRGTHVQGSH